MAGAMGVESFGMLGSALVLFMPAPSPKSLALVNPQRIPGAGTELMLVTKTLDRPKIEKRDFAIGCPGGLQAALSRFGHWEREGGPCGRDGALESRVVVTKLGRKW